MHINKFQQHIFYIFKCEGLPAIIIVISKHKQY